jgi:Flp pilus assembly pilin Flp
MRRFADQQRRRAMMKRLARKMGVRCGQTTAEYAIIVALIAICSIGVILIFGDQIRALFAAESHQLAGDKTAQPIRQDTNADSQINKGLDKF